MGAELKRLFADAPINKILTIKDFGHRHCRHRSAAFWRAGGVCQEGAERTNLDGEMYTTRIRKASRTARFSM